MDWQQIRRPFGLALAAIILAPLLAACGESTGEGTAAATAAAATQTAAATAAPVAKTYLAIVGDTTRGGANLTAEEKPYLDCVLANRFPQGSAAIFRFKVLDPLTGQPMDDKALKSVTLTMGNNVTQEMKYIGRPTAKPTDYFWRYVWKIPTDYPTGQLNYKVDAVDLQGRTGTYSQFTITPTQVVIVPLGTR